MLARVVGVEDETAHAKSIVLDPPNWPSHLAGQHVDVRLTAEDGYQAQRSYSIGSAPEDDHLVLTVERLDDGEVSPYLTDVLRPGDELELRGPIGGYFVWEERLADRSSSSPAAPVSFRCARCSGTTGRPGARSLRVSSIPRAPRRTSSIAPSWSALTPSLR